MGCILAWVVRTLKPFSPLVVCCCLLSITLVLVFRSSPTCCNLCVACAAALCRPGQGAAMVIEPLALYYHIECFRCCVCYAPLGTGERGTDVRVRASRLHCQNCYSSDEGITVFGRFCNFPVCWRPTRLPPGGIRVQLCVTRFASVGKS